LLTDAKSFEEAQNTWLLLQAYFHNTLQGSDTRRQAFRFGLTFCFFFFFCVVAVEHVVVQWDNDSVETVAVGVEPRQLFFDVCQCVALIFVTHATTTQGARDCCIDDVFVSMIDLPPFTWLRSLRISYLGQCEMPPSVGLLTQLRVLESYGGYLTSVDLLDFKQMSHLTRLNVRQCHRTRFDFRKQKKTNNNCFVVAGGKLSRTVVATQLERCDIIGEARHWSERPRID
jgi:hypothetical protein